MPNAEEQEKKTIELSNKKTSFTERVAAMIGMKPREIEEVVPTTEKSKTFGKVFAITTEAKQDEEQVMEMNMEQQPTKKTHFRLRN